MFMPSKSKKMFQTGKAHLRQERTAIHRFFEAANRVDESRVSVAAAAFHRLNGIVAFPTTHWSALALATLNGDSAGRAALAKMCADYRAPILNFLRRRGYSADAAEELAPSFGFPRLEKLRVVDEQMGDGHDDRGRRSHAGAPVDARARIETGRARPDPA